MLYSEIREQIQTGDIIAIRKRSGIIAQATIFFTHSPYTHAGIAIWLNGGLWMAEINSGHNHLVPLSQFEGEDFDVFDCPVNRKEVEKQILESLRVRINYGIVSFVIIGLLDFLRVNERLTSMKAKVCSEYVQTILINSGWNIPDKMVSPIDLVKKLKLKFEVRH